MWGQRKDCSHVYLTECNRDKTKCISISGNNDNRSTLSCLWLQVPTHHRELECLLRRQGAGESWHGNQNKLDPLEHCCTGSGPVPGHGLSHGQLQYADWYHSTSPQSKTHLHQNVQFLTLVILHEPAHNLQCRKGYKVEYVDKTRHDSTISGTTCWLKM